MGGPRRVASVAMLAGQYLALQVKKTKVESPRLWDSWVAVKELNLSYYIGETLLFTIYTHYGNLI